MYLLDTNVLSELRRRDRIDPRVAAWNFFFGARGPGSQAIVVT